MGTSLELYFMFCLHVFRYWSRDSRALKIVLRRFLVAVGLVFTILTCLHIRALCLLMCLCLCILWTFCYSSTINETYPSVLFQITQRIFVLSMSLSSYFLGFSLSSRFLSVDAVTVLLKNFFGWPIFGSLLWQETGRLHWVNSCFSFFLRVWICVFPYICVFALYIHMEVL